MEQRSVTVPRLEIAADSLGYFRWGRVAGKVLVTNDAGDWMCLSEPEFADLLAGRIVQGHPRFEEMQRKALVRDGADLDALAARIAARSRHIRGGPHLHVVTLTLRTPGTNGALGDAARMDMSAETAEKVVDMALESTAPSIAFELQGEGGEPLLNGTVLRRFVEYARATNQRAAGKNLRFRIATNLTAMTEDAAEWLIANDVLVSTTLDGPAALHDWTRTWKGGSAHAQVVRWIEYFARRYAELGRDRQQWQIDALVTVSRRTLPEWRALVDEYVARGLRSIHLQPLQRWRVDAATWSSIGFTMPEYVDFYRRALDYIVDLNRRGIEISERTASMVLSKILTSDDPGIVDLQSPSGDGTGQLAYDVDGRVFPSDDARLVDAAGDALFELGRAGELTTSDVARHTTVRAIAAASLLDVQPMCADCWNKPYCGFSPVRNFIAQGDLFGQRPHCAECQEHMAVSTKLFELLTAADDTAEILKRWSTLQIGSAAGRRLSIAAP